MEKALIVKFAVMALMPLAEKIVESTDNEFDDKLIEGLKYILGKAEEKE